MRNYKNESEWEKQKYKRITIKLDKDTAKKFENKLNGKPVSTWIKEQIEEFVNEKKGSN